MGGFATVLFVTLTLAASAPARVVHIGGEVPSVIPECEVAAGASDEDVLPDLRDYFDERSYAWAPGGVAPFSTDKKLEST